MILTRQLCNEHDKEQTMADLEHNKQTVIGSLPERSTTSSRQMR